MASSRKYSRLLRLRLRPPSLRYSYFYRYRYCYYSFVFFLPRTASRQVRRRRYHYRARRSINHPLNSRKKCCSFSPPSLSSSSLSSSSRSFSSFSSIPRGATLPWRTVRASPLWFHLPLFPSSLPLPLLLFVDFASISLFFVFACALQYFFCQRYPRRRCTNPLRPLRPRFPPLRLMKKTPKTIPTSTFRSSYPHRLRHPTNRHHPWTKYTVQTFPGSDSPHSLTLTSNPGKTKPSRRRVATDAKTRSRSISRRRDDCSRAIAFRFSQSRAREARFVLVSSLRFVRFFCPLFVVLVLCHLPRSTSNHHLLKRLLQLLLLPLRLRRRRLLLRLRLSFPRQRNSQFCSDQSYTRSIARSLLKRPRLSVSFLTPSSSSCCSSSCSSRTSLNDTHG